MSHAIIAAEPRIPIRSIYSPRLRIVPVLGDGMAPTLLPHRDFALCLPITAYDGEGVYLIGDDYGGQDFFRAAAGVSRNGMIRIFRDNGNYHDEFVSAEWFNGAVLAKVVGDIKVRDHVALREAANG